MSNTPQQNNGSIMDDIAPFIVVIILIIFGIIFLRMLATAAFYIYSPVLILPYFLDSITKFPLGAFVFAGYAFIAFRISLVFAKTKKLEYNAYLKSTAERKEWMAFSYALFFGFFAIYHFLAGLLDFAIFRSLSYGLYDHIHTICLPDPDKVHYFYIFDCTYSEFASAYGGLHNATNKETVEKVPEFLANHNPSWLGTVFSTFPLGVMVSIPAFVEIYSSYKEAKIHHPDRLYKLESEQQKQEEKDRILRPRHSLTTSLVESVTKKVKEQGETKDEEKIKAEKLYQYQYEKIEKEDGTIYEKAKFADLRGVDWLIKRLSSIHPEIKIWTLLNPVRYENSHLLKPLYDTRDFALLNGLIEGFANRPEPMLETKDDSVQNNKEIATNNPENINIISDDKIPIINTDAFNTICKKQLGNVFTSIDDLEPIDVMILGAVLPFMTTVDERTNDEEAETHKATMYKYMLDFFDFVYKAILDSKIVPEEGETDPKKLRRYEEYLKNKRDWDFKYPDGYKIDELRPLSEYPKLDNLRLNIAVCLEHPKVKELLHRHAYIRTFTHAVVLTGRNAGVIQPSSFVWTALYSREYWAFIQNIGRGCVYAECMGVITHYYHEVKANVKQYDTDFTPALKGLEESLARFNYPTELVLAFDNEQDIEFHSEINRDSFFETTYRDLVEKDRLEQSEKVKEYKRRIDMQESGQYVPEKRNFKIVTDIAEIDGSQGY